MEMPITRPSKISYADEINFSELLRELSTGKHNGFIRVTSGSDEGYLLFKDGKIVAASFGRSSRSEAIENITSRVKDDVNTLIEVFDTRASQVDYLLDLNKPFQIESDYADVMGELEKFKKQEDKELNPPETIPDSEEVKAEVEEEENLIEPPNQDMEPLTPTEESIPEKEILEEGEIEEKSTAIPEQENTETEILTSQKESIPINEAELKSEKIVEDNTEQPKVQKEIKTEVTVTPESEIPADLVESNSVKEEVLEEDLKSSETEMELEVPEPPEVEPSELDEASVPSEETPESVPSEETPESVPSEETTTEVSKDTNVATVEIEEEPVDRSKLLEKYGIKDMDDSDVEDLLNSYKGGTVSDEDIEKIELTVMNRIKKTLMGIPKVKSAEVMVFLDNTKDLTGNVNIIIEYESSGFLSRIMGESRAIADLRKQVTTLTQIEIKKTFRGYQEIVDKFEINIEIS